VIKSRNGTLGAETIFCISENPVDCLRPFEYTQFMNNRDLGEDSIKARSLPILLTLIEISAGLTLSPGRMAAQTGGVLNPGSVQLYFENDTFAGTDRCYTGGIKLSWVSGCLENPRENRLLKWLPLLDDPGSRHALSLSLGQNIYTPDDITRSDIIEDDRPYAGNLYLSLGIHSRSERRCQTLGMSLGIVGPHAYAMEAQRGIHKIINGVRPLGWTHQLGDELALGFTCETKWKTLKKGVFRKLGLEFINHLAGGVGNIYTYASSGAQFRFGWNLPGDFGASLIKPNGDRSVDIRERGGFGVHFFILVDGKAVLRDIFLDGNTFRDSHRVDKKNFTADIIPGFSLRKGRFNFNYSHVYWTRKFTTESRDQVFGTFSISYSY